MSKILPDSRVTVDFTFLNHHSRFDMESTDNLQAEALAASFSNTNLTAIYSSPLKRALMTAKTLQNAQPKPKPPIETSLLLREQHYGLGEGQHYDVRREPGLSLADHFAQSKFPPLRGRTEHFPEGESLDDVAVRAKDVVEQFAIPYIKKAAKEGTDGIHIAFVSHGMFIGEAVAVLMRKDKHNVEGINARDYRGLRNTGWTRVTVQVPKNESSGDEAMNVRVSVHNSCEHLDGLVRQKGGIGSSAYDPKQRDLRAFFKGAEGISKTRPR
ncbi:phosphoglycerate mutase-like protein [Tricholoma matsutake]|nr:phosphoglycerate mutase-like protein [Tricholoma matsutake 945]